MHIWRLLDCRHQVSPAHCDLLDSSSLDTRLSLAPSAACAAVPWPLPSITASLAGPRRSRPGVIGRHVLLAGRGRPAPLVAPAAGARGTAPACHSTCRAALSAACHTRLHQSQLAGGLIHMRASSGQRWLRAEGCAAPLLCCPSIECSSGARHQACTVPESQSVLSCCPLLHSLFQTCCRCVWAGRWASWGSPPVSQAKPHLMMAPWQPGTNACVWSELLITRTCLCTVFVFTSKRADTRGSEVMASRCRQ